MRTALPLLAFPPFTIIVVRFSMHCCRLVMDREDKPRRPLICILYQDRVVACARVQATLYQNTWNFKLS